MDRLPESRRELMRDIVRVRREDGEKGYLEPETPLGTMTAFELTDAMADLRPPETGDTYGPWVYDAEHREVFLEPRVLGMYVPLDRVERDGLGEWVRFLVRRSWSRYAEDAGYIRAFVWACEELCDLPAMEVLP